MYLFYLMVYLFWFIKEKRGNIVVMSNLKIHHIQWQLSSLRFLKASGVTDLLHALVTACSTQAGKVRVASCYK